jgi:hypothetical protein
MAGVSTLVKELVEDRGHATAHRRHSAGSCPARSIVDWSDVSGRGVGAQPLRFDQLDTAVDEVDLDLTGRCNTGHDATGLGRFLESIEHLPSRVQRGLEVLNSPATPGGLNVRGTSRLSLAGSAW